MPVEFGRPATVDVAVSSVHWRIECFASSFMPDANQTSLLELVVGGEVHVVDERIALTREPGLRAVQQASTSSSNGRTGTSVLT